MLKKILIAFFAAICVLGMIGFFGRRPSVPVGNVKVTSGDSKIAAQGYRVSSTYKEDTETFEVPELKSIIDDLPSVLQEVDSSAEDGSEILSDFSVSFQGDFYGSVYYTVYDENGTEIAAKGTQLNLPTGKIEGCVVKVSVVWGKAKNNEAYDYYFKVEYKYK